jgi:hypothetical protein
MHTDDIQRLKAALAEFTGEPDPISPSLGLAPAIRVVECVLSLRARFYSVVVPRVKSFARTQPQVQTCGDLVNAITTAGGPLLFIRSCLDFDSEKRGRTLLGVAGYLHRQQLGFQGDTEVARLEQWAKSVAPDDYRSAGIPGFGIAGFQYMRMLFGADTTKPDVHIVGYISDAVGRQVSQAEAWKLLAAINTLTGVPVRTYDAFIWHKREKSSASRRRRCASDTDLQIEGIVPRACAPSGTNRTGATP